MNNRSHWEHVYTTRSAEEVSWYQPHAEQSLSLIERVSAGRPGHVIDVGGGASTLVDDLLLRKRFDVTVLDLSGTALEVARQRLGVASARCVHWLIGDVTLVELPEHGYDIWHDRAVFHFLTDTTQRAAYVAQVRRSVKRGGHVIVAAFGPDGPLQCSGLPVVRYSPDELHGEFGDNFELVEHTSEAHYTPAGKIQQFVYCHCIVH